MPLVEYGGSCTHGDDGVRYKTGGGRQRIDCGGKGKEIDNTSPNHASVKRDVGSLGGMRSEGLFHHHARKEEHSKWVDRRFSTASKRRYEEVCEEEQDIAVYDSEDEWTDLSMDEPEVQEEVVATDGWGHGCNVH